MSGWQVYMQLERYDDEDLATLGKRWHDLRDDERQEWNDRAVQIQEDRGNSRLGEPGNKRYKDTVWPYSGDECYPVSVASVDAAEVWDPKTLSR